MRGLLIRWIIQTLAIMAAAWLLGGIEIRGPVAAIFAAAVLGVLNALLRPLLLLFTLPLNILTLGLFTFVINAVLLLMTSGVSRGFVVHGFWSAVAGSLVISLVSWLLNAMINDQGTMEVIEMRRRGNRWEP
ncbi:MAG: phage holin family protein [Desulfuromonadales bacterium]|nr:phage holin family protein [Desulfuromonadales bacterium]MDT8422248.1 phage holin family protein [Desulfuromonadales bacterium]